MVWVDFDFQARKRLGEMIREIIMERREKNIVQKNLLSSLLNFTDENGQFLSDDQIADNIIGVLFAAQDTTASMLTWVLKYIKDGPLLNSIEVYIIGNYWCPNIDLERSCEWFMC